VTLVEGSTFCLSDPAGDIVPEGPVGLFVLDARVLSRWELRVDGQPVEALSSAATQPFATTFVSRTAEAGAGHLLLVRRREIGSGMRETLEVRNYGRRPRTVQIELCVATDFADVFDVKAGVPISDVALTRAGDRLSISGTRGGVSRSVHVAEPDHRGTGVPSARGLGWRLALAPHSVWSTCLEVTVDVQQQPLTLPFRCGAPAGSARPRRHVGLHSHAPALTMSDPRLVRAVSRAVDDVSSLVIEDPQHPEAPVIAAGAPWFMALFGRDSLLTSYMSFIVDPALAIGVLRTLARLQGTAVDLATEEQPGRILHEVRFNSTAATDLDDGHIYYGTADATPLFVMLVGELARWGADPSVVEELLPHVDRALAWIENYGDSDGDGYVEYERLNPSGLANQGWKDSWDSISSVDGSLAEGPVALAEVQGYVYAAYLARAELAVDRGDDATVQRYQAKAAHLRAAFDRDFWLPEHGWFALALDGAKRPVDALASNMGHCLWTGIVEPARAAAVAALLVGPELRSGWGVRTMATSMARYDPLSYHNGSVWPHDTALAAAGLSRYGFADEAAQLIDELLEAAEVHGGRLPELYAGLAREDVAVPVSYPSSCSPQAWASAAPLLMLRTLLALEPSAREGVVRVAPATGRPLGGVTFSFAGARVSVQRRDDGSVRVTGLPAGVVAVTEPPARPAAPTARS